MNKQIILEPVITEKASMLGVNNRYIFKVSKEANKIEVRKEIEKIFNVKVKHVNTTIMQPKKRRVGRYTGKTSAWRKAFITLHDGFKIANFEKLT